MSRPLYEIVMSKGATLDRVALVKRPAVGNTSMFFSEDEQSIKFSVDEEKRLLYAPAMIPKKLIFRKDVFGSEADTFYTAETIKHSMEAYFKKNGNKETNIEHTEQIADGVYPVESWIVYDNKNDKATALGFDVPNDTWMMCHKIENDSIWEQVKNGDLTGLSVEMFAKYELKDSNNANTINMNTEEEKGFFDRLITAITHAFEPKKPEAVPATSNEVEAESVSEGEPVEVETQELTAPEDVTVLKAENEDLKMKLQEATDKIAQHEIDMNKGKEQSVLYTAEIEELKSKIAFSKDVEIPKVPNVKKKPEEMTALEKAKAMYE